MSSYLKKAVQKILIRKRHRIYEERIARQAVPYGVWLENLIGREKQEILRWKEEKERAGERRLSASTGKARWIPCSSSVICSSAKKVASS